MADRTRKKTAQDSDDKLDSIQTALAAMLTPALEEQRAFIEKQFAKLNSKLEKFGADIAKNTEDIKLLKEDQKELKSQVCKLSDNSQSAWSKLEASLAEHEDRSRRENIRILNLPESIETSDMRSYLLAAFPKWFPGLSDENMEVMRAHRIGPERTTTGFPRTVICRMLRFTDRDRVLKASRDTLVKVSGKELRFTADYSSHTIKRRRAYAPAMDAARRLGFTPFLIYPARLKLTRGAEVFFFNTHQDAEDFVKSEEKD